MDNWPRMNHSELPAGQNGQGRQSPPRPRCFVLAVANQKGGVAKTTTVVSLGGALVRQGQEVLLVDLDAQANLTLALGKEPTKLRVAITDVFFDSASLLSSSRETDIPGLDLVPSNKGMDVAERFLPMRNNYETILKRAINGTTGNLSSEAVPFTDEQVQLPLTSRRSSVLDVYNFVLLDCPPLMGVVTLNALIAADILIIPTQPEYFSAHALGTMMETIRQVRSQHNPKLAYRVLITMMDRRNRIHREVNEQIRGTFAKGIFQTMIPVDTKLRESAVEGLPITHYKSRSRSAQQYDALAQELIEYVRRIETFEAASR